MGIYMNISKQLIKLLKAHLDGKIDRENLNLLLRNLHSKIIETKKCICDESSLYVSIIHWIALTVPEYAYNDDEIRYVYKAVMGEEGYDLQYTYWIPNNKHELNNIEQRIIEISQKYISNYTTNTQYIVFDNQKSCLEESDIQFIRSLCSNKYARQEFRKTAEIPNVAINQLLNLLKDGQICHQSPSYDTNRLVMEKLNSILSSYQNDLPVCCVVSLKKGVPTLTIS